jgi:hypothetical protein
MSTYNRSLGESVRIGNWFEENKLKEETGIRYYADPTDRQTSLLTKSRVISHTDQILPKDYVSVTRSTVIDPRTHPEYGNQNPRVGPRQQRLELSLRKMVDEEVERKTTADFKESRKFAISTVSKDSFGGPKSFTPTLKLNDRTVRLPTQSANYSTDTAVTYYSHAISDPNVNVSFPTTFVGSINPFRKNNLFSADIRSKVITMRTETNERPKPLPTVREFKTLNSLRSKLMSKAGEELQKLKGIVDPGAKIRYIVDMLISPDCDYLVLTDLEKLIYGHLDGLQLNESERVALLSAFDIHDNHRISVGDTCLFFKRTPSPRRLEVINYFFNQIDMLHDGSNVPIQALKNLLKKNGSKYLSGCIDYFDYVNAETQDFSIEDFFDYCTDISSEIENDEEYEQTMKDMFDY